MNMRKQSQAVVRNTPKQSDLKESILGRMSAIATMLADSFLLAVWAVSTWAVNSVITRLELSGAIEKFTIGVFQWLFLVSTLIPVVAYTFIDINKVIKHTLDKIKKE